MKAQVTFETDFFKPAPGEEERTNPGRFGHALALWLQAQLEARGMQTEEVIAEDFGWVVMISRKPFLLWLGCGNTDGSITERSVFPVVEVPFYKRLFSKPTTANSADQLWDHIKDMVPTIPGVRNIRWE
jgi:hypothetical protein